MAEIAAHAATLCYAVVVAVLRSSDVKGTKVIIEQWGADTNDGCERFEFGVWHCDGWSYVYIDKPHDGDA